MSLSISIHALLAESDAARGCWLTPPTNFYPRSPCGERRPRWQAQAQKDTFLSTLSLRRATDRQQKEDYRALISIHALLAESDRNSQNS